MTRAELEHLDARYRALRASGSGAAELAFRDWRRAAVAYAEERRPPAEICGDEGAPEPLDEFEASFGLSDGEIPQEPHLELVDVGGDDVHAPIFEQPTPTQQSPIFTGEEHA